ncbi:MAG: cellulase family glycosylhydrolase, partial [Actinomycetota bacterium]|nr:cellulase family glycosylhydrolase [Actinomycetota bacterium]
MLRKAAMTAVIALLGTFGQLAGSTAPAHAATATPVVGVQFKSTWSDYTDAERIAVLDKLAAANVKWVRIDVGWRSLEESGRGVISQWYLDRFSRTVDAARARGINVLATLWATPTWANGGQDRTVPPTDVNDYASIAQRVAAHMRGRVAAWEVWNEPNLTGFWAGKDPVKYAALVRAAYPAFKAGDPGAAVVAGAVSQNDTAWLTRMYDAGVSGSFDVLSTHPYQGPIDAPPELPDDGNHWIMDHIGAVRQLMVARGDAAKPIWATEFGWSSHPNTGTEAAWDRGVSEQTQADYLVRSLSWFAARHPYVTQVFWYTERNRSSGDIHEDSFGLLRQDLTEKPAFTALKGVLAGVTQAPAPVVTAPTTTT